MACVRASLLWLATLTIMPALQMPRSTGHQDQETFAPKPPRPPRLLPVWCQKIWHRGKSALARDFIYFPKHTLSHCFCSLSPLCCCFAAESGCLAKMNGECVKELTPQHLLGGSASGPWWPAIQAPDYGCSLFVSLLRCSWATDYRCGVHTEQTFLLPGRLIRSD